MARHALSVDLIKDASEHLARRVRKTPLEPSPDLSRRLGAPVWLKLENLQLTGSFKIRGAYFRLSRLDSGQRGRGVVTCSAGNHGKALAFACRQSGVHAEVYVPSTVDESKYRGMLELGAEVIRTEFPGYDEAEELARQQAGNQGKVFISPFDDFHVMAGNGGTLAQEVLDQAPNARQFLLPVGGGGLSAGFSFYAKESKPDSRIIACQLAASPALQLSLERNEAVTRLPGADTAAGGLEGGLGKLTFEVLRDRVSEVALIEEEGLSEAMVWMLEHHQYLIEPSAAVTVAAMLCGKAALAPEPTVLVVSGRNVALDTLRRLLESKPKPARAGR